MSEHRWRAALCALLVMVASGCSKSRPSAGDSESHFLMQCDGSCPGDLECICGVCTLACSGDAGCAGLAGASCEATPASAACEASAPARACTATCDGDADCADVGPELACLAGQCRASVGVGAMRDGSTDDAALGDAGARDAGAASACLMPVDTYPTFGNAGFEVAGEYLLATQRKTLLRFDGKTWQSFGLPAPVDPTGRHTLWAAAPNDVFYVTERAIMHFDGARAEASLMHDTPAFFTGVFGFASDDVWAVGYAVPDCVDCTDPAHALIYHHDGRSWTRAETSAEATLWGIWGAAPDDVWAAGDVLLHWDGSSWSDQGTSSQQVKLWGRGADEVYQVNTPDVRRWDGAAWSTLDAGGHVVWDLHGLDDGTLYALAEGPLLLRLDGGAFVETGVAVPGEGGSLQSFGGELLLLQPEAVLRLRDGSFAPWIETFDAGRLDGLWSRGSGQALAVRGDALLRYDGGWQIAARVPPSLGDAQLYALDGRAPDDLWIVANFNDPGGARAFHWDGQTLEPLALPNASVLSLADVYVAEDGGVWAIGQDGESSEPGPADPMLGPGMRALRLDGDAPRELPPPPEWAHAIDGAGDQVYLAGDGLMRWDGAGFVAVEDEPFDQPFDLHVAAADDVYVLARRGTDSVLVRYDGQSFEDVAVPEGYQWKAIDGLGPDDLWLTGETRDARTALVHFDGARWRLVEELDVAAGGAVRPTALGGGKVLISNYESTWVYGCAP